ncbi:MAG: TrkA family potassium uptake protein [Clostridiales bacterium]|nr:TrkA family potassium uptake protein [Clostridiales bacterium]
MKKKKRSFCIIGLGRFGQTLAINLARTNHQVLVIDSDDNIVNAMSDIVTNAVVGDPTNEAVLRAAGVRDYDCAIIATADNINDSILVTLTLKEMGIAQVVVRASSDQHRRVLEKIGADMVVFPEQDMGEKLVGILDRNNVLEYIEFSDRHSIVEVAVPDKWVGKSLAELDVRKQYGVTVLAVSDPVSGMNISPDPTRPFTSEDTVALLGENTAIDKITK